MDALVIWLIYKIAAMLLGFVCIFLGYKLIIKGVFAGSVDINAAWDNNRKLLIKKASPGVVLFFIGFGVVLLNIYTGEFKQSISQRVEDEERESEISSEKIIQAQNICDAIKKLAGPRESARLCYKVNLLIRNKTNQQALQLRTDVLMHSIPTVMPHSPPPEPKSELPVSAINMGDGVVENKK